jgi:fructose-1,6-bisphosphatase/inositol monophosphatase family enzyme
MLPSTDSTFIYLLVNLVEFTRAGLLSSRKRHPHTSWAEASHRTEADTLFKVDLLAENLIIEWLQKNWPKDYPIQLIIEGTHNGGIFPASASSDGIAFQLIIDPIDGTRGLMHDKRAAWILAGLAPKQPTLTNLSHITHAVMAEVPTSKQTLVDTYTAHKHHTSSAIFTDAHRIDLNSQKKFAIQPTPYTGSFISPHSFASFVKFFPAGRALTSQIEEALWIDLLPDTPHPTTVFDDQYISTGGQLAEIIQGHDVFVADLRPLIHNHLGIPETLSTHPYDLCTLLIAQGYGCVVETPDGKPIDAPLDTTTPVAWVAYANSRLAELIRPVLIRLLNRFELI